MNGTDRSGRVVLPADSARIVTVLAAVWVSLQAVGVVVGLTLIGRDGTGPVRHLDASVHGWFIAHRTGLVVVSRVGYFLFDAPVLGFIVVSATVAVIAWNWTRGEVRWSMLGPLAAYLGAEATVYVVRLVIHRPRPVSADFPAPGALAGIHETSWSFPSGHATASMAVLVAVAGLVALRRNVRWPYAVAVAVGVVVALTRLVLGVHWMTDVATGAVLGGTWGATVCWAQNRTDTAVISSR